MTQWWSNNIAEIFGLIMSSSLAIYSIILIVSPLPRTYLRHAIIISGLLASLVGLWHSGVEPISPWPIGAMALWLVLLTTGSVRYRSRVIAARFDKGRRVDDD